MTHNGVATEVGGEPAREHGVVLDAHVVERFGAAESRQGRGRETYRRLPQRRLCDQVVVEHRRAERSGQQENGVIGPLRSRLVEKPTEMTASPGSLA